MGHTKLALERVVFLGRTFEEYMQMFALSEEKLKRKKVLDCPAGACSFTARGRQLGINITACDIAYYHSREDLENKGFQDIEHAMVQMEKAKGNYKWDYFKHVADLKEHRLQALKDCVNDMKANPTRYVAVTLPTLPFKDEEFDLLLSAHFLFTYADRLDIDFHLTTIDELLRVTKEEIRLFPLVDLEGKRYVQLDHIFKHLHAKGCTFEEVQVNYEFQRNANSMLVIKKNEK